MKYLIIFLLGVSLYNGVMQATGISYTFIGNDEERCTLSQAPTTHYQNIRYIYNHIFSTPIDNVDSMKVPNNKSYLQLLNYFRMYSLTDSLACGSLVHFSFHPVPDPLSYYVFRLREIII